MTWADGGTSCLVFLFRTPLTSWPSRLSHEFLAEVGKELNSFRQTQNTEFSFMEKWGSRMNARPPVQKIGIQSAMISSQANQSRLFQSTLCLGDMGVDKRFQFFATRIVLALLLERS